MSNPARRLYEIYSGWASGYGANATALDARGLSGPKGVDRHLEVFRLLIAIRHALDYLETRNASIATYQAQYYDWVKMALHAPNNWGGGSNPSSGFPPVPMAHLDTFATLLDFDRPALAPEPEAKLRNVVNEVIALLLADETLDSHLREYVFKLVNEVRTALDDEAITGSFDFADAAHRLYIAIFAAAGQSKTPGKWRQAAAGLFRDAGAAALGNLPTMGLTIAQIQAAVG